MELGGLARTRHEHLRSIHQAAGRHVAADGGARCWPARWRLQLLPVAPLPQVDFPIISVGAGLPGASPETMASAVATPLERQFGRIAGVNRDDLDEPASARPASPCSSTSIATSMPRRATCRPPSTRRAASCPPTCRAIRTYRKVNPADAPILILALTSDIITKPQHVRRRRFDPGAEAGAGRRRRPGDRGRRRQARRARRAESDGC